MSVSLQIQQKIQRLEALRRYQAYYGPNTPYQIISEINQLEVELRRMLKADLTRPTETINPDIHVPKKKSSKKPAKAPPKKAPPKKVPIWHMSQATFDIIATIGFIGLVFLLGSIVFAAYTQTRSTASANGSNYQNPAIAIQPTLRPTFTPTANPDDLQSSEAVAVAVVDNALLPPAHKEPTEVPTPVPTLTPSAVPSPTSTPSPTLTPIPTNPPPPPPPPPATPASAEPTPVPAPSFPFSVAETGNRVFQRTNYHLVTIYVAITTLDNVPIGGLKVVGDHVPSGRHVESALSDWNWSKTNCLDCDYVKFGNVKFEPGPFEDGTWNIYVADGQGTQLSPAAPFSYSSDPNQWYWDFVIFRKSTY